MRSSTGELNPRRGRRLTASATADLEAGEPEPKLQPLEGRELLMRVLPCVLVASLGAFSFGYHLGIVNPALDYLARDLGIALNTQLKGLVVSTVLVGATMGSLYSGRIADGVGRRTALVGVAAPLFLGSVLCGFANNVWFMLLGRLLAGVGIGASSNLVPMYIAEVSPAQLRGTLGSLNQLMICVGILVAVVAGVPLVSDPNHWRNMFLFAAIPGLMQGVLMTVVPESPGWLRRQGKVAEAAAAETALWGAPDPSGGGDDKDDKDEKKVSTAELFAPANRKAVTIGTGLFFLQQMSGVNAVVYFSSAMFVAAGVQSAVAASGEFISILVYFNSRLFQFSYMQLD
jgi:MFS family permease